ncbi:hypothetical protein BDY19DRAFT_898899, partial [Irpex rosettiformis]
EEVVVSVQGYALRVNLPPVTRKDRQADIYIYSLPKNILSAKQSIVLTGLGAESFTKAAHAVLVIRSMFTANLPHDSLLPWTPIVDSGHQCLEFSNRYFSTSQFEGLTAVDFDPAVDPKGILASLEVDGKHTDDNVVLYFERLSGKNNREGTYVTIKPVAIRPGTLVEVQTSFAVVPLTKGRYLMLNKLRSICILSKQVQDIPETSFKRVKRSVGYSEDVSDTEDSQSALKRLRLDEKDERDDAMRTLPE